MLTDAPDRHRRLIGRRAIAVLAATLVVVITPLILRSATQKPIRADRSAGGSDYPEAWKTTLDQARSLVIFDVIVPDDVSADAASVDGVFVAPDGEAIALRFPPPPLTGDDPVRQDFIEVFESQWRGGDPAAAWAEDVVSSGIVGEAAFEIAGVPALGVTSHSPTDIEGANPAFLRFVYKRLDIQISGGDDLDRLVQIAESMIG